VRQKLRLQAGDRVTFIENEDGDFVLKAKTGSLAGLKGCVKWTGKPVTIEEMNETIRKGWAGELTFDD
jgi:bifunctional DNA-binding transcriptional regulator/antitoxin component of YhaV-PrlF toxin-antitoxin module